MAYILALIFCAAPAPDYLKYDWEVVRQHALSNKIVRLTIQDVVTSNEEMSGVAYMVVGKDRYEIGNFSFFSNNKGSFYFDLYSVICDNFKKKPLGNKVRFVLSSRNAKVTYRTFKIELVED